MNFIAFPSEADPPLTPVKPSSPWQNETVCAWVRKLWEDHSASEICKVLNAEFGINIGRNSVVGWLFRQNLTVKQKTKIHPLTSTNYAPRPLVTPKPRSAYKNTRPAGRPKVRHESPELKAMRCEQISPLGVGLLELEPGQCRYPFGNGPFVFCGLTAEKDRSYCSAHLALTTRGWVEK